MSCCRFKTRLVLWLAAIVIWAVVPATAFAQGGFGGGGFGGGGLGGGGFGGGGLGGGGLGGGGLGGGGVGGNQQAGVRVDAQGILRVQTFRDTSGRTAKQRFQAAMTRLDPKLSKPNPMRKISLTRLEKAVAKQIASGQPLTDEMKYLAGMLRVQYVFFYPETGDIVVAGPAEGFAQDASGRVRGLTSGRPVLQLEDLLVALRAYPPNDSRTNVIGVSIDPTPEGLQRMRNFLAQIGRQIQPGDTQRIASGLRQALGLQTVTIDGISSATHFAQVLVEADYRMKLIGIGLERPPVKITSYVSQAKPRNVARNALQRWYFTPDYKCLRVSKDDLALEMVGWGVKLVGASELVQEGGERVGNAIVNKASEAFCQSFTKQYPRLANLEPVYAQLRNLIDISVAAAFIQTKDFYGQANWDLGVFADEQKLPVETCEVPKKVESAVNAIWKGNTLMTPIGGGVDIQPLKAVAKKNLLPDTDGKVEKTRNALQLTELSEGQWWWD